MNNIYNFLGKMLNTKKLCENKKLEKNTIVFLSAMSNIKKIFVLDRAFDLFTCHWHIIDSQTKIFALLIKNWTQKNLSLWKKSSTLEKKLRFWIIFQSRVKGMMVSMLFIE